MQTAGYSQTPLAKKLGIKPGFKIKIINPPDYYFTLFADMPEDLCILDNSKQKKNLIHYFATQANDLNKTVALLKEEIEANGIIWVSWPKKASKVSTDITENIIREAALRQGLVDIKVCAIDDIWSALKLVIPVKEN